MKMRYEEPQLRHYRSFGRKDGISVWGSCFAQEVGNYLERELYSVTRSPYGIIYNPMTMARGLELLLEGRAPSADDLFLDHGAWHSFMHHGDYSSYDKDGALSKMVAAFEAAEKRFEETSLFIFTFGTASVFELEGGAVVNNCHRMSPHMFHRRTLSVGEIVERWRGVMARLLERVPKADLLFTVSPVPHYRNGAHESRLSKARLLLAVDELSQDRHLRDHVFYFNAYELMVDELRDYRFYATDFAHPTPQAVSYIMERFSSAFLNCEAEAPFTELWHRLRGQLEHRPLTDSPQLLRAHYSKLLEEVSELYDEFPHSYLRNEMERLESKVNSI